jgi:hypothetical protein
MAAVLTLALGLGAATAIFSVADSVLLRPLPYPTSDRLVMVRDELSKMGVHYTDVSYETFIPQREGTGTEDRFLRPALQSLAQTIRLDCERRFHPWQNRPALFTYFRDTNPDSKIRC